MSELFSFTVASIRLIAGLMIALGMGYFLAAWLSTAPWTKRWRYIWVSLSPGLGLGLSSLIYFYWRILIGPTGAAYLAFELAVLFGLGVVYWQRRSRIQFDTSYPRNTLEQLQGMKWLLIILLVVLGLSLLAFFLLAMIFPHGSWDSWAIWMLAGRYLYRVGADWHVVFSSSLFHPDYPMLIGASVARLWTYQGGESQAAPILIMFLFASSAIAILISALSMIRDNFAAILGGLAVLGGGVLIVFAGLQGADVPLAYIILTTLIVFTLAERYSDKGMGIWILGGVLAALATWTKNEGWLFLIVIGLAFLSGGWTGKPWRVSLKHGGWALIGAAPVVALVLYYRLFLAPENDLIAGQSENTLMQLFQIRRYLEITRALTAGITGLGEKGTPPVMLLLLSAFLFGLRPRSERPAAFRANLIVCGLILSGYFLVYLITPYDLGWHLDTSVTRLILHIWPALVFTTFLAVRLPEVDGGLATIPDNADGSPYRGGG
jgi:hypothetical protein